jgi:methionyl-tRNA formyltransferase
MTYLFCAYREYSMTLYKMLSKKYKMVLLTDSHKLTLKYVKKINPKIIFFPDWSWIVPSEIINNYTCVCFHESSLPKFRGGSPIQNQIIRGIKKTKSTAFVMTCGLDEGDILLQQDLSLEGTLKNIFERMIKNDYEMITKIIEGKYKRRKQVGEPTIFKRRRPEESELKNLDYPKLYLYNFIRMLEDPYPNAFLRVGKRKIVFKSAKYDGKKIQFCGDIV